MIIFKLIEIGQHKELADALIEKRGKKSKRWAGEQIGICTHVYTKLEDFGKRPVGNTSYHSQHLARRWVNSKKL